MKLSKILIALALCLCITAPCVLASEAIPSKAIYNSSTDTLTVSGTAQTSGNIVTNEVSDTAWGPSIAKNGGTASMEADGAILLSGRTVDWHRLAQNIDGKIRGYGAGAYRISGSAKLGADPDTTNSAVKIGTYISYGKDAGGNAITPTYAALVTKEKGADTPKLNEYQPFSAVVNVTSEKLVGTDKIKLQLATNETSDMYFKDVVFEYIPSKVGVAVKDASGAMVYADEIATSSDGTYKTAFQLKDANQNLARYTVNVYSPAKGAVENVPITSVAKTADVTMVKSSDGKKVTVTFDVFDYVNVRNNQNFIIYAANYKDNMLAGVNSVRFAVSKDSSYITQSIDVNSDADSTSLFLFNEVNGIFYPIAKGLNKTF